MRTLILLTALLLLAFQAQAQTLQETADQAPAEDQPGVEDQDLLGDEDQDVVISFTGEERLTRQLPAVEIGKILAKILAKTVTKAVIKSCHCRRQHRCPNNKVNKALERVSGACNVFGRQYRLCCK